MTGIGETEALVFVRESLAAGYGDSLTVHFEFSDYFPAKCMDQNIVSIGGPRYNRISKEFRDFYPSLPLYFDWNKKTFVVNRHTGEKYEPKVQEGVDYGVITRVPNPINPEENVVLLIEGAHTYGLACAGRILTSKSPSSLIKRIREVKSPYWQALVEATVSRLQVFPTRVEVIPLDPTLLRNR